MEAVVLSAFALALDLLRAMFRNIVGGVVPKSEDPPPDEDK